MSMHLFSFGHPCEHQLHRTCIGGSNCPLNGYPDTWCCSFIKGKINFKRDRPCEGPRCHWDYVHPSQSQFDEVTRVLEQSRPIAAKLDEASDTDLLSFTITNPHIVDTVQCALHMMRHPPSTCARRVGQLLAYAAVLAGERDVFVQLLKTMKKPVDGYVLGAYAYLTQPKTISAAAATGKAGGAGNNTAAGGAGGGGAPSAKKQTKKGAAAKEDITPTLANIMVELMSAALSSGGQLVDREDQHVLQAMFIKALSTYPRSDKRHQEMLEKAIGKFGNRRLEDEEAAAAEKREATKRDVVAATAAAAAAATASGTVATTTTATTTPPPSPPLTKQTTAATPASGAPPPTREGPAAADASPANPSSPPSATATAASVATTAVPATAPTTETAATPAAVESPAVPEEAAAPAPSAATAAVPPAAPPPPLATSSAAAPASATSAPVARSASATAASAAERRTSPPSPSQAAPADGTVTTSPSTTTTADTSATLAVPAAAAAAASAAAPVPPPRASSTAFIGSGTPKSSAGVPGTPARTASSTPATTTGTPQLSPATSKATSATLPAPATPIRTSAPQGTALASVGGGALSPPPPTSSMHAVGHALPPPAPAPPSQQQPKAPSQPQPQPQPPTTAPARFATIGISKALPYLRAQAGRLGDEGPGIWAAYTPHAHEHEFFICGGQLTIEPQAWTPAPLGDAAAHPHVDDETRWYMEARAAAREREERAKAEAAEARWRAENLVQTHLGLRRTSSWDTSFRDSSDGWGLDSFELDSGYSGSSLKVD